MLLRDLGPLLVRNGHSEQPIGGTKAPAILAMLAVNANSRVSTEALMSAAWGERVTAGAASTLESHVWRLRQLLEPARGRRQAPTVLINDTDGYRLIATVDTIDSLRFEQLAAEVRDLLAAGDPGRAVRRADEALALWRGRPFGTYADEEWATAAVARLTETRDQLLERRIDALLATGQGDRALADLEVLIAATPYREGLWGQRMTALYRGGRSEEALQTYQRVRTLLQEEIGVEPGPALQELHRRILNQDPELRPPTLDRTPQPTPEIRLPSRLTSLIGRGADVAELRTLLAGSPLTTVVGPAGCGKTRLVIDVARAVAQRFPDGVWFVDLTGASDPGLVVDVVASAIGFSAPVVGTPLDALAAYLRDRQSLVVLDNCEHVLSGAAELVEAMLDDGAECRVLATSREPLGVPGEVIWTLGPLAVPDDSADAEPTISPAVELFLQRLRAGVPTLQLDPDRLRLAAAIAVAVDGLPLALELAAARGRSATLEEIAAQVTHDPSDLRRIGRGPTDHRRTVRSAIEWSYRLLTPPEQVAHRMLSVLQGPFPRSAAQAVVAIGGHDGIDVDDLLAQLVHRSLLVPVPSPRSGGPSLFNQLATVRGHAHHTLVTAGEDDAARCRRDAWVEALVDARPRLGRPEEVAWSDTMDDAYPSVRATLQHQLVDAPGPAGVRVATGLLLYWYYRSRMVEGARWLQLAASAPHGDNAVGSVRAGLALATALSLQGRVDLAGPHIERALRDLDALAAKPPIEIGDELVGLANAVWSRDEFELVRQISERVTALADEFNDADLDALAMALACIARLATGDLDAAAEQAEAAYARATALDNNFAGWTAAGARTVVALLSGRPHEGLAWSDRTLAAHLRLGGGGAGAFLELRANLLAMTGDHVAAVRLYSLARRVTRRAGMPWPRRPVTDELLQATQLAVSRTDYERAWREGERLTVQDVVRSNGQGAVSS